MVVGLVLACRQRYCQSGAMAPSRKLALYDSTVRAMCRLTMWSEISISHEMSSDESHEGLLANMDDNYDVFSIKSIQSLYCADRPEAAQLSPRAEHEAEVIWNRMKGRWSLKAASRLTPDSAAVSDKITSRCSPRRIQLELSNNNTRPPKEIP